MGRKVRRAGSDPSRADTQSVLMALVGGQSRWASNEPPAGNLRGVTLSTHCLICKDHSNNPPSKEYVLNTFQMPGTESGTGNDGGKI